MRMKILNSIAVFLVLSISPIGAAEDFVEVKNVSAPPSDILSGRLRLAEPSALPTSAWTALVPFERGASRTSNRSRKDGGGIDHARAIRLDVFARRKR